jgi:DNA-binding winged helix-turn-helix (wHTH) protein/tetratricopeptide (TPR) repeat protein
VDDGARIDLATQPSRTLGHIELVPSLLEVRVTGIAYAVPPRVMQVLVALLRAEGRTVSRGDLAESCWEGRVVGEDALNRVIGKIRRIANGPAQGSFAVETIKRIGYRVVVPNEPAGDVEVPVTFEAPIAAAVSQPMGSLRAAVPPTRRKGIAIGAVLVLLAAATWHYASRPTTPAPAQAQADEPLVLAASDLETRGLSAMFEGMPDRTLVGIDLLQQATKINPTDARIWGALAMANVLSLADADAGSQPAIVQRVREAAGRAQAIDPKEGRSIAALLSLQPTFGTWAAKDIALQRGLARARPGTAPLIFQRTQFLIATGRIDEALTLANEVDRTSPFIPWIQATRINLLAAHGRFAEAERAADRAGEVWPRQRLIWFTRFYLAAYGGRPDKALALAQAGGPDNTDPREVEMAVKVARALVSRSPADADAVVAAYRRLAPVGQGFAEQAIRAAAALGRVKAAIDFATLLYGKALPTGRRGPTEPRIGYQAMGDRNSAILFLPPANRLWQRPEMARIAEDAGLQSYWQQVRRPDVCRGPRKPPVCQTRPTSGHVQRGTPH